MLYHTFPNMCFTEFHVSLPQLEDCKKVSEEKAIQKQEEIKEIKVFFGIRKSEDSEVKMLSSK